MLEINNLVILNNTTVTSEELIQTYEFVDSGRQAQPVYRPMFNAWGLAPEDAWRNFTAMMKEGPWQTVVTKEELENKFHFKQRLLSFASQYAYVQLAVVTKEDICKLVYDKMELRESTTKSELILLLKNEIAFKEKCKEYVFDTVEFYPDVAPYDPDKYQDIVNTYNEIQ